MTSFLRSFVFALKGVRTGLLQRNLLVQSVCAILTIALGFYFDITGIEWCLITLSIGVVLSLELINSAIENIVNMISPGYHPTAGKIKDLAAGAVLIASVMAAVVGCIIFRKYFIIDFLL